MESVYTRTFTVESVHVDCFGRAKASALLYFAQEAAGAHCQQLALDYDTLAKKNLFWAVIRNRVQITRAPVLGQTITVKTWPMPTTRSSFPRSTVGYDEKGNELFRSISLWVLMDTESRAMVLPGKSNIALTGSLQGGELTAPGSIAPRALENTSVRRVCYTELDRNIHMNNTRYLDWIDDLFPSAFHKEHPVQSFTVCYLSEAREGQEITLHWQVLEDACLQVDGYRRAENDTEKQTRVFAAQLYF